MKRNHSFAIQTFLSVLILNGILLGSIYWLLGESLAVENRMLLYLGIGGGITLLLWLVILFLGGRLVDRTLRSHLPETSTHSASQQAVQTPITQPAPPTPKPAATPTATAAPVVTAPALPDESAAVQMLSILQRKGRLVDFLQEELDAYQDAQIGAAVRSIHAGCREALDEYVQLEPVFTQTEGSQITVEPGFDANAIRLSGAISGEPPFHGILRHRGWRVKQIDLPKHMGDEAEKRVIAPAEIEVS